MATEINIYGPLTQAEMNQLPMEKIFEHLDWMAAETDKVLDGMEQGMREFETALATPATPEEEEFLKLKGEEWYRKTAPTVAAIEDGAVSLFNSRMAEAQKRVDARG